MPSGIKLADKPICKQEIISDESDCQKTCRYFLKYVNKYKNGTLIQNQPDRIKNHYTDRSVVKSPFGQRTKYESLIIP